jgi:hypothetical protein
MTFIQSLPALNYGIQATSLSRNEISTFSFVYNSIFYKLFGTKNIETIHSCQFFTGFLSFEFYYEQIRFLFLHSLFLKGSLNPNSELDSADFTDYSALKFKYNINDYDSKKNIKLKFWNLFTQQIR